MKLLSPALTLLLFLVACSAPPDPTPNIPATVVAQVQRELAAQPTATPYPTYTPYPTHTPYPTATPRPTYTPYPIPATTNTPSPTPTIDVLLEVTFRCIQDNPGMKAGFIAGFLDEVPGSEALAEHIANDFDAYKSAFASLEDDEETREALDPLYSFCPR